jgi:hypothetical protein
MDLFKPIFMTRYCLQAWILRLILWWDYFIYFSFFFFFFLKLNEKQGKWFRCPELMIRSTQSTEERHSTLSSRSSRWSDNTHRMTPVIHFINTDKLKWTFPSMMLHLNCTRWTTWTTPWLQFINTDKLKWTTFPSMLLHLNCTCWITWTTPLLYFINADKLGWTTFPSIMLQPASYLHAKVQVKHIVWMISFTWLHVSKTDVFMRQYLGVFVHVCVVCVCVCVYICVCLHLCVHVWVWMETEMNGDNVFCLCVYTLLWMCGFEWKQNGDNLWMFVCVHISMNVWVWMETTVSLWMLLGVG